jgi:hypothetical protein
MNRTLRNTGALLLLTAVTCLAIYGTVQATAALTGVSGTPVVSSGGATSASGSSATLTCPRTGCAASYCHATSGGGYGGYGTGGGWNGGGTSNGTNGPASGDSSRSWQ